MLHLDYKSDNNINNRWGNISLIHISVYVSASFSHTGPESVSSPLSESTNRKSSEHLKT